MSMDTTALLAYKVEQMEENLRLTVQTKTGYRTLQYQTRWLDRQIRAWVGSVTGFVDRDSFSNFMLSNHYIGTRDVVERALRKVQARPCRRRGLNDRCGRVQQDYRQPVNAAQGRYPEKVARGHLLNCGGEGGHLAS